MKHLNNFGSFINESKKSKGKGFRRGAKLISTIMDNDEYEVVDFIEVNKSSIEDIEDFLADYDPNSDFQESYEISGTDFSSIKNEILVAAKVIKSEDITGDTFVFVKDNPYIKIEESLVTEGKMDCSDKLIFGELYMLLEPGMDEWMEDMKYVGMVKGYHTFVSDEQLDDFEMEYSPSELLDAIKDNEIKGQSKKAKAKLDY